MTKLFLKYNPYTVESQLILDGEEVKEPNKLVEYKNERMQVWIEELMPVLCELTNDNEYEIEFYGTQLDYEDLEECVSEYKKNNADIDVTLSYTVAKGSEYRFQQLTELFQYMQETCPFEDLKTDQIKENFMSAISSEFEVSVIATMSSGKSTLINSLLGQELMPSKNSACTATIARIKDVDELECFQGEYLDQQGNILGKYDNVTLKEMEVMNGEERTAYINLEGNIPNISSQGIPLVLIDTPGPNNSRTEKHKEHTYKIIKEKSKPMVLYVLNGTQLETDDDQELLKTVAEAMKVGGKQSKDRFIFAINKMDAFDSEKESIEDVLNNVRNYLANAGIESPNVFPISAEYAKVIRMNEKQLDLTKKQQITLLQSSLLLESEEMHLSQYASLSSNNKRILANQISETKKDGNELAETLIYTGVPAIELAIDEYLKKYAYTTKVKTAVDTFMKKVEEKDMHSKLLNVISENEKARKHINEQLKNVKQQLEEGNKAQCFKQRIQNLDLTKNANKAIGDLRKKISDAIISENRGEAMSILEVQQMMANLDQRIRSLQTNVKTELEAIIEDVIINSANNIVQEYQNHIKSLLIDGNLQCEKYEGNENIDFLAKDIPDAQEIINTYKYEEEYDTGESEWVVNENKKWYKPWTWFSESGHYRTIYADREMVDYGTVYNEFIQPVIANFNENLDNAKTIAEKESQKFRTYFLLELEKLDEKLKEKVKENEILTSNQKNIADIIQKNEKNILWLEDFMKKLNCILEI